jgi:hypothetical protein
MHRTLSQLLAATLLAAATHAAAAASPDAPIQPLFDVMQTVK